MNDPASIIEVLREDINLTKAPPAALEELAREASRLAFDKGDLVFQSGDDADRYYLVESGRVVMSLESPTGKAFTFRIADRGTPLNAVTCFSGRPRFFTARVAEQASVITIPGRVFRDWVQAHPEVALGIIGTMGDLLNGAYARLLDMVDGSVEARILNALSTLSTRSGTELPLTNADVAELVGTSRETAARVVSRLQGHGLIAKSRGTITIVDKPRLDESATNPFLTL